VGGPERCGDVRDGLVDAARSMQGVQLPVIVATPAWPLSLKPPSPRLKQVAVALQKRRHAARHAEFVHLAALARRVARRARKATNATDQRGRLRTRSAKPRLHGGLYGGLCRGLHQGIMWQRGRRQREEGALGIMRAAAVAAALGAANSVAVTREALRVRDKPPPLARVAAPARREGVPRRSFAGQCSQSGGSVVRGRRGRFSSATR
jgi:hypothetical protein